MSPTVTSALCKMQKPVMSLKQFMLRSEILKLYKGFMRLGNLLNDPPPPSDIQTGQGKNTPTTNPMKEEWIHWVRSEFRLRQHAATDEDATKTLLTYGKRQLQEMERTIMLATNRNEALVKPPPIDKTKGGSNYKGTSTTDKDKNGQESQLNQKPLTS